MKISILAKLGILILLVVGGPLGYSQEVLFEPIPSPFYERVTTIAISPHGHIFAGTWGTTIFRSSESHMIRSTDNGISWKSSGLLDLIPTVIGFDSTGSSYAGEGLGFSRSSDNGETWATTYLEDPVLSFLATADAIFIGSKLSKILQSSDGGVTWIEHTVPPFYSTTSVLSLAMTRNGQIFAGGSVEVFRSSDNGASWERIFYAGSNVVTTVVGPRGDIFIGTRDNGVFRTPDNGATWIPSNNGLPTSRIFSLTVNKNGTLFAALSRCEVYRSTNDGVDWEKVIAVTDTNRSVVFNMFALASDSTNHLFAGSYLGLFRSADEGDHWVATGARRVRPGIVRATADGSLLAPASGSIVHSIDEGNTWTLVALNNGDGLLDMITMRDHIILGSVFGTYQSADGGRSWSRKIFAKGYVRSISADQNGFLYATSDKGLYGSSDEGEIWNSMGFPETAVESVTWNALNHVFAATYDKGVFRSTDRGENWTEANTGLSELRMRSILSDTLGRLYACTWGSKLFRSTDNGESWIELSTGFGASVFSSPIAKSPNGILFVGTWEGFFCSADNGVLWATIVGGIEGTRVNAVSFDPGGFLYLGTDLGAFKSRYSTLATPTFSPNKRVIDFGVIGTDSVAEQPLLLRNSGTSPLNIESGLLRGDAFSISGTPLVISPGDSSLVSIRFSSAAVGEFANEILFTGRTPFQILSHETLSVRGRIEILTHIQGEFDSPHVFRLERNYPNPFNPATTIEFSIPLFGVITLKVFNLLGEEVETLVAGELSAGRHSVRWDATGKASGIYFYRLQAGEFTETKKLLLLR